MSAQRIFLFFVTLTLLFFLLIGCKRINPEPPAATGFDPPIPAPESYLIGRVTFELADIEKKINEKLGIILVDEDQLEGTRAEKFHLRVERVGPIRLQYIRRQVVFSAPLRIWVGNPLAMRKKRAKPRRPLGELYVRFRSPVEVTSSWRLSTDAKFVNYRWVTKPKVRVLGINIAVQKTVDKVLEKQRDTIEKVINQSIGNEVRLERELGNIWRDLQKPILLNKKVDSVWLVPRPQSIAAAPLSGNTSSITVPLRIGFATALRFGPKPVVKRSNRLPKLRRVTALPPDTDLHVLSNIAYADLNTFLANKLLKRDIKLVGGAVEITDASVYGGQQAVIVKTEIRGAVKGTLYFRGRPYFDTLTNTLQVRNVDFDVHTEEVLLGTADWLLHDSLRDTLTSVLKIPLESRINKIPGKIEQAIARGKAGQKVNLDLSDFHFLPQQIAVRPEGLQVLITIRSKVKVKVKKL